MVSRSVTTVLLVCLSGLILNSWVSAGSHHEEQYYRLISIATPQAMTESRSKNWRPAPNGLVLEVSGIAILDDRRVAVAIRKGEVWILDGVYADPPASVTYHRFASALHEPLGLLKLDDGLYAAQRSELTRMRDLDGDQVADEYLTVAKGWGVTGNYHEYAYGPKLDAEGNLWVTLNIGMGLTDEQRSRALPNAAFDIRQGRWRGWALKVTREGNVEPICGGMRSPSGLGANAVGDMFYTDQQGNWVATNALHHMRRGAFFHHPDALASMNLPNSPLRGIEQIPDGLPLPAAVKQLPQMKPPAVWLPYVKAGQSATDILLDDSGGRFGPFAGQLFIGEFTQASIQRVFLEKVEGQYQGAVFPFRSGFASAVLRMAQAADGSLFVGLSNRGWSSLGTAAYGLQRLVWTGKTPFEIKEMRARHDGFELVFTQPVDRQLASQPDAYALQSYTYRYHAKYGSDEIDRLPLVVSAAVPSSDGLRVVLHVTRLRELYVHELNASGIRSASGDPLLHPHAFYTLNRIPPAFSP